MSATSTSDRVDPSPPPRRGGLSRAASDGWVVARRNLIKIKRVPEVLVFVLISPIMFVLLFAYVFGGAIDPGGDVRAVEPGEREERRAEQVRRDLQPFVDEGGELERLEAEEQHAHERRDGEPSAR